MTPYADAARSICAFVARCGNKPDALRAAIRSVAAHRYLDPAQLARQVSRTERRATLSTSNALCIRSAMVSPGSNCN